jgi:hypothetical protein
MNAELKKWQTLGMKIAQFQTPKNALRIMRKWTTFETCRLKNKEISGANGIAA